MPCLTHPGFDSLPGSMLGDSLMGRVSRHQHRSRVCFCAGVLTVTVVLVVLNVSGLVRETARRNSAESPHGLPFLKAHSQLSEQDLAAAISRHHPIHRLECGNWMEPYAKMHKAILSGEAPQRYALMRSLNSWENGLADRLASSVGILMFSILSGRAFQYHFEGEPQLWEGLRSDYIDWRYTGWDGGNDTMTMDYVAEHNSETEFLSFFLEQDFASIGKDKHTVIWHADHSVVYKAFDNPHAKARLEELGLKRDTAFACLFDFLYRPTQEVVDMVKPQLPVLLAPDVVKIGIQIRVGDWQLVSSDRYVIHPQSYSGLFNHYFDCASEIERQVASPGDGVVWYLLADTATLRESLAAKYPDRVLAKTDVEIEHTVKSSSHSRTGFLAAVSELWAFSLTDWHVVTRKSGFGKVGAMVSANGPRHIFSIDFPMQIFSFMGMGGPAFDNRKVLTWWQGQRSCNPIDADDLSKLCMDFTGC